MIMVCYMSVRGISWVITPRTQPPSASSQTVLALGVVQASRYSCVPLCHWWSVDITSMTVRPRPPFWLSAWRTRPFSSALGTDGPGTRGFPPSTNKAWVFTSLVAVFLLFDYQRCSQQEVGYSIRICVSPMPDTGGARARCRGGWGLTEWGSGVWGGPQVHSCSSFPSGMFQKDLPPTSPKRTF